MARRKNWRRQLQMARTVDRLGASTEATAIEARLQARLAPQVWNEVESEWKSKDPLDSYLPQQRRDFLVTVADRHDVSLAGIPVGGW